MPRVETLPTIDPIVFHHPVCMIVSGTTGCGKSNFVKNVIEYDGIDTPMNQIWYFMPQRDNHLHINTRDDQELHIRVGLPSQEWWDTEIGETKDNILVVIDDQWGKAVASEFMNEMILTGRRHWLNKRGVSVICISQNYFQKSNNASGIK
jgi:hypothetical protein